MDQVVLDTDFINGITAYQSGDPADLFRRIFQALELEPVVCSYVAENELVRNPVAGSLIAEGFLKVLSPEDVPSLGMPGAMEQYRNTFRDLYARIKNAPLPNYVTDIFSRHGQMSFGEIHSVLLATEAGIPLLYSNDSDAKSAARYFPRGRLTVKNAEEVAEELKDSDMMTSAERKYFRNYYRRKAYSDT